MRRPRSFSVALAFAVPLVLCPRAGDGGPSMLALAHLPAALVQACHDTSCPRQGELVAHWLGGSAAGDLFMVRPTACTASCDAWLVERTRTGVAVLLAIDGGYRLADSAGSAYPEVQVRKDIDAAQIAYRRYTWGGSAYVQVEAKDLYRVDGRECGTREECNEAADAALRSQRVGQALKIWEAVDGVSWI